MSKLIEYEEKDIESAIFVAEQLCFWTKKSPDIIKEYMYGDNGGFVGHIFFGDMINIPLFDLLENDGDEEEISKYIHAIILMFNMNNPYLMNILDVTVFEYLSDSKKVWNKLGELLPFEIINYINDNLIKTNIAMCGVKPVPYNYNFLEMIEFKIIDKFIKISNGDSFDYSNDERFLVCDVINWLSLEYKRYLYTKKGKKDLRKNFYIDDIKFIGFKDMLNSHKKLDFLFEIENHYFKFKDNINNEIILVLEKKVFMEHIKIVHIYRRPIVDWKDDNNNVNKVLFDLPNVSFPTKCPICGEKKYHMYMTRFDENDNHGSGWVWCSGCKNYSHYQYLIPDDYKNCPAIDDEELCPEPDYLDANCQIIDDWINKFYSNEMKCPKCNSELIENIKFGSREYFCPNCNYGVSAFVNEPIEEDDTIYELCIIDEAITIDKIKVLSKISNYNFLDVKKICVDHSTIYRDNAKAMKNAKTVLDEASIKYTIKPEFKW